MKAGFFFTNPDGSLQDFVKILEGGRGCVEGNEFVFRSGAPETELVETFARQFVLHVCTSVFLFYFFNYKDAQ